MTLLKLATIALAVLTATPMTPSGGGMAYFTYGRNARGEQVFDLGVPATEWDAFAGGERLDIAHPQAGPKTWRAVYEHIEWATKKAGICSAGWMLGEYSLGEYGTRHFKGFCSKAPLSL